MPILIDRRDQLKGKPGLHAFIVGVSTYQFLPKGDEPDTPQSAVVQLRQLASAAISAYKLFSWLKENQDNMALPLATCRLLVSPSAEELAAAPDMLAPPEMQGPASRATRENFLQEARAWRDGANSSPENATLFYFAGHGAQRTKDDGLMLLEDFAESLDSPLDNAVEIGNIFKGMATSLKFPQMAQTQFYFVDTCRDFLQIFRNYEGDTPAQVFREQLSGEDSRCAPIFFASVPGKKAYLLAGEQTLFSKALINCLENDAGDFRDVNGEDKWAVSVFSLSAALSQLMMDLNQDAGTNQEVTLGGQIKDTLICILDHTPLVKLRLEIDPADALQLTRLSILDGSGAPGPQVPFPITPHPYNCTWPAGIYSIGVEISPPDPRYKNVPGSFRLMKPPVFPKKFRVTP